MDKIEEAVIGEGEIQTDGQLEGLSRCLFPRKQWSEQLKHTCVCSVNCLLLKVIKVEWWEWDGPVKGGLLPCQTLFKYQGVLQGHAREFGNQRVLLSEPASSGCWQKEGWLDVSNNSWLLSLISVFWVIRDLRTVFFPKWDLRNMTLDRLRKR